MDYQLVPLGECAVMIKWGSVIDEMVNDNVMLAMKQLEEHPFEGMEECVPAYASLAVYYNPVLIASKEKQAYSIVCDLIRQRLKGLHAIEKPHSGKVVEIPVCYEGELAPDLAFVARENGLSKEDVIRIHSSQTYRVYMLGFAPGFPYLGGLDEKIAAPRRTVPRPAVAAGSVGIAGTQTGIYPLEMPGGWQIIGRTPFSLFDLHKQPPVRFVAGDSIRFVPIERAAYDRITGIEHV